MPGMPQEPYYAPDEMFSGVEPDTYRVWPWIVGAVLVGLAVCGGVAALLL